MSEMPSTPNPAIPETVPEMLVRHEANSQSRYEHLKHHIDKGHPMSKEEVEVNNIFKGGVPGGGGDGISAALVASMAGMGNRQQADGMFGGGGMGALLALALLGRRGLGGDGEGGCANNALQLGIDGINHNINNLDVGLSSNIQGVLTALTTQNTQSTLGAIEGAIPLAACNTMAAISAAAADTNTQTLNQTISLQNTLSGMAMSNCAGFQHTQEAIAAANAAQLLATKDTQIGIERASWAIAQTVTNEGEKTRALISRQYEDTLNRELTDVKNEVIELRGDQRRSSGENSIRIDMINNQNQNQLQMQQQQQSLGQLAQLLFIADQNIRATNQAINIGGTQVPTQSNTSTNSRVN